MAAPQIISFGIGSPASIPNFLLLGLGGVDQGDPDVPLDPTVVFCVPEETRVFSVPFEGRVFEVKTDDRTIRVPRRRCH